MLLNLGRLNKYNYCLLESNMREYINIIENIENTIKNESLPTSRDEDEPKKQQTPAELKYTSNHTNVVRIDSIFYRLLRSINDFGPTTDRRLAHPFNGYAERLAASGLLDKEFDPTAIKNRAQERGVTTYSMNSRGKKVLNTLHSNNHIIYSDVDGNPIEGPLVRQDVITHPHLFDKEDYPQWFKKRKEK
jgi:hypothetical protein